MTNAASKTSAPIDTAVVTASSLFCTNMRRSFVGRSPGSFITMVDSPVYAASLLEDRSIRESLR